MSNWEKLFELLQIINPQSDTFKIVELSRGDEKINSERWDNICDYMDCIKNRIEESE